LSDAEIDLMWAEAEALYPAHVDNRQLIFAAVRLEGWRNLMVQASKRVDYRQNQSEEKMSQLLKNMETIEARFKKAFDTLLTTATMPAVKWGGISNIPNKWKDKPNG
ncbi:MAG TPA: hypothetical protein PLZ51_16110, partial [Aggregatilineales bacterium]|nr:hypothetical protein [Aggregatilineales bacterium]